MIHVLRYDPRTGRASRAGTIAVPPPGDAPLPQSFPPTETTRRSWPRDLAVSPDGKTLLAALNLADYAAVIDTASRAGALREGRQLPVRRRDLARREVRARVERVRRHGVGDRPRLRQEGEGHPGGPAPVASRGDRHRSEARPRLRGGDGAGPDRRDQPAEPDGRAHAHRGAAAGDRHGARRGARDERRLLPAERRLGRGRARRVRSSERPRTHVQEPAETQAARARGARRGGLDHQARGGRRRPPPVTRVAARRTGAGRLLSGGCGRNPAPPDARVAGREGARRRAEPERPQPAVAERLRRPHQQLPVPAIDRARGERHPPLPDELAAAPDDAPRGAAAAAVERGGGAGGDADPDGRPDPARLLHRAREPHVRPDPRRRLARRRRPQAHPVRREHHAERARPGQAVPAARPRVRELGGVDRRPLLDGGGLGVRLRREELAPELRRPRAAVRLRRLRGHLAVAGLPLRPGREAGHLVLQLRRGGRGGRAAVP